LDQLVSRFVISKNSDRERFRTQCAKVVYGIGSSTRNGVCFAVIEHQHRSFPRDSRDLAVNEDVCHQIAKHDNALA
jgi:hypothetical protein